MITPDQELEYLRHKVANLEADVFELQRQRNEQKKVLEYIKSRIGCMDNVSMATENTRTAILNVIERGMV